MPLKNFVFASKHGILGTFCVVLHAVALSFRDMPRPLVAVCIVSSSILAVGALGLLNQAPARSEIAPGIVAPHREAFRRTIMVCLYINLRCCRLQELFCVDKTWLYTLLLLVAWLQFIPWPSTTNYRNGNTLVFVIPIFLGISLDASREFGVVFNLRKCSEETISTRFLVKTQLGAQLISFAFTLAFRKHVSVRLVYIWSAACVAGRFFRLIAGPNEGLGAALTVAIVLTVFTSNRIQAIKTQDLPPPPSHKETTVPKTNPTRPILDRQKTEDGRSRVSIVPTEASKKNITLKRQQSNSRPPMPSRKTSAARLASALVTVRSMIRGGEEYSDRSDDDEMIKIDEDGTITMLADIAAQARSQALKENGWHPDEFPYTFEEVQHWATQSFIVHKRRKKRALDVTTNLLRFRIEYGWPIRLDAKPLEAALRSGIHWVLPYRDLKGRRIVVYNASVLASKTLSIPVAELQQVMGLLLERVSTDPKTLTKGIVFLVDLHGASASTIRHFALADIKRGMDLVKNAFPLRLKQVFVIHLPRTLEAFAFFVRTFLPSKIKKRLHTSSGDPNRSKRLLADIPSHLIPTALGGTLADFDWDSIVDRLLLSPHSAPADDWLLGNSKH